MTWLVCGVLLLVALPAVASEPQVSVALDLTQLGDRDYSALDGLGLEKRLVLRLVQEGFAVVGLKTTPQVVIRVEVRGALVLVTAEQGRHRQEREIVRDRQAKLDLLHLELSQKAVDLVRALHAQMEDEAPPRAAEASSVAPQPRPVTSPPSAAQSKRASSPVFGAGSEHSLPSDGAASPAEPRTAVLAITGGALLRGAEVDPVLRLGARLSLDETWRAGLSLGLVSAPATAVRAIELTPSAEFGAEVRLGARFRLGAGVRAGVLLHGYKLKDDTAAQSSGWRADGVLAVPLRISLAAASRLVFDLCLAPGLSTRGRSHQLDDQTLWRRGPGQLELTLGAGLAL